MYHFGGKNQGCIVFVKTKICLIMSGVDIVTFIFIKKTDIIFCRVAFVGDHLEEVVEMLDTQTKVREGGLSAEHG